MTAKLTDLKWVLVDQINDLTTATEAIREHIERMQSAKPPHPEWSSVYFRMCSTSLIISLAKLWEALDHYNREIHSFPEEVKLACRTVKKQIETRKIYQFRSKYAAHVIDKETKKPLSRAEGTRRYKAIVGDNVGDLIAFCDWICPALGHSTEGSVIAAVVAARDQCIVIAGSQSERP